MKAELSTFCLALALLALPASAQTYPVKPIRMVSGFSPGSSADSVARALTPLLTESLGQPVVVEIRGGAGGTIAADAVAKSPPDGYTLLLMAAGEAVQAALRTNLPYDLERDLAPVSILGSGTAVLAVHPLVPAKNLKEVIALARSRPGKLSYGSSGVGSSSHLMGELFNLMAGIKLVHVPYKGSVDGAIATAGGQIEMSFPAAVSAVPLLETGKLRAIAVTSAKRSTLLPQVPTFDEAGLPGYDRPAWWGVMAPAAVPKNIIGRLNAVIVKGVATPEMKAALLKQGADPQTNSPEQFAAFIRNEIAVNRKLVKQTGVKVE